ncbi:MAG: hypothetical protein AB8B62_09315 [Roseobacter sp.]
MNFLQERCLPFSVALVAPKTDDIVEIAGPPWEYFFHHESSGLTLVTSRGKCTVTDIFDPLSETDRAEAIELSTQLAMSFLSGVDLEQVWPGDAGSGFLRLVAVLDDRTRHPSFMITRYGTMAGDAQSGNATTFTFNPPRESGVDA